MNRRWPRERGAKAESRVQGDTLQRGNPQAQSGHGVEPGKGQAEGSHGNDGHWGSFGEFWVMHIKGHLQPQVKAS